MKEVEITDKISIDEFIERLPPFLRVSYKEYLKKNRRYYITYNIKTNYCNYSWYIRIFGNIMKYSPDTFQKFQKGRLILALNIWQPCNTGVTIHIEDYFCRNALYRNIKEKFKQRDIFIENIESLSMEF
jgi:hypothetical protein